MGAASGGAPSRTPNTMHASVAADSAKYLHKPLKQYEALFLGAEHVHRCYKTS